MTLEMPNEAQQLNEESAGNYFRARLQILPFLKNEVIDPIEKAVKENTEWNDKKRPKKVQEQEVKVGEVVFHVTTTPTTKRPGYKEVYEHTTQYLDTLKRQQTDGVKRKGVVDRDGKTFIGLNYLVDVIAEYKKQVLRAGIAQKLETPLKNPESKIAVPIRDYGKLPHQAGEIYQHAKPFHVEAAQRAVKSFVDILEEETGFSKEHVPGEPEHTWKQTDRYLFHIISSPTESVKYGEIMNALLKETKNPGKKTGDFHSFQMGWETQGTRQYDVYRTGGKLFIALKSLEKRIAKLVKTNTTPDVRHTHNHYPLQW